MAVEQHAVEGDKHYITLFVFVDAFEGEVQLLEPHKCEGWEWFEKEALPLLFSLQLSPSSRRGA